MNSGDAYASNLMRGRMLREQNRFKEAESYLNQAVQARPQEAEPYCELAFCYCNSNRPQEALKVVDRALQLAPNDQSSLALRSWILGNLNQHQNAIAAAADALAQCPTHLLAINARTRAWINLRQWQKAEESAREAVALDPHGSQVLNLLACILRMTSRSGEANELIRGLLADRPNDSVAHTNAGWIALELGQARQAQIHFRESLRIDPNDEGARQGLLQSLHARVWFYRWYFKFTSFVVRRSRLYQVAILMSLYCLFLFAAFGNEFPHPAGWSYFCGAVFTSFILAKSLGDCFLFLDVEARLSLSRLECSFALFVALGFTVMLAGIMMSHAWLLLGLALVMPGSFVFALALNQLDRNKEEKL